MFLFSSPTSSRNSVPPLATSKSPLWSRSAPVNAPLRWPNSSLSTRFSDRAPQLTGTNGMSAALALLAERAGGQLLAGAGLAEDHDASNRSARPCRSGGGPPASPATRRPGSVGPSAACTRRLQGEVLVLQLALLGDLAQDRLDLGQLARLGDVVERAEPHAPRWRSRCWRGRS